MEGSEQGFNTYREGTTGDEEDDSSKEESSTSSESSSSEEESGEDSGDNGTDREDVPKEQDVNRGLTSVGVEPELTRPTRNRRELMTSTIGMSSGTNAITLKTAHPDPFRGGTTKTRIFILQVDNKITDAARASEGRKIRYAMSLLREVTTEWTTTHTDQHGETTFNTYQGFKKAFLERFTDPNPTGTVMEKLLNIRQGKLPIQEYVTRALNLANKTGLGDQATRTLIFRGLHYKDQERVMLANSLYSEEQLAEEGIEEYLKRISTLIRRNEVRRTGGKTIPEYGKPDGNNTSGTTWGHGGDPMELDEFNKEKRKCFKCGKVGHIRRFCRSKGSLPREKEDTLAVFEESENENVLEKEGSQDEEL